MEQPEIELCRRAVELRNLAVVLSGDIFTHSDRSELREAATVLNNAAIDVAYQLITSLERMSEFCGSPSDSEDLTEDQYLDKYEEAFSALVGVKPWLS